MNIQHQWPQVSMRSLPQDMVQLPTIEAEPWVMLDGNGPFAGLEGPAFDKESNLYVCHKAPRPDAPEGVIYRVTPEREISIFWRAGKLNPVGIAIHRDGRLFLACMTGEIAILSPDGELLKASKQYYNNESLCPNDLVFDRNGNLYFTDFRGSQNDPAGGIFRLDQSDGYNEPKKICGNLRSPNGISFSPDYRRLWIGESCGNNVLKLELEEDGSLSHFCPTLPVFRNTGIGAMDSNKVDSAGNIYQTIMGDGRIAVLNSEGMAIGNVVAPDRERGHFPMGPNLSIKPGTNEAYWLVAGPEGSWVFRFPALANAQHLYMDI